MTEELLKLLRTPMETERLILRPWKKNKADAKALYASAKDPKVGPAAGWPVHKDVADSMQIIRDVLSTPGIYAMVSKETMQPVGTVGVTFGATGRKYMAGDEGEIGYWVGRAYWGKGYAPEAVNRLMVRCFTQLSMNGLWCAYYEGNEKSSRVQEKCGFTYHHKNEPELVAALGEMRTEHFTYLSREKWKLMQ